MAFHWLDEFIREQPKPPDYAEKTLAAYHLGIKAGGAIRGVRIQVKEDCCEAAKTLPPGQIYTPDQAPHLPLQGCTLGKHCRCTYRPVMTYQPPENESTD